LSDHSTGALATEDKQKNDRRFAPTLLKTHGALLNRNKEYAHAQASNTSVLGDEKLSQAKEMRSVYWQGYMTCTNTPYSYRVKTPLE